MRRDKDAKGRAEKLVSISTPLTTPSLGLMLSAHLRMFTLTLVLLIRRNALHLCSEGAYSDTASSVSSL